MAQPITYDRFEKQEKELVNIFENLEHAIKTHIQKILSKEIVINDEEINRIKTNLSDGVEKLHLAVSNYFGDCDKQKQIIEKGISKKINYEDFDKISSIIQNM